MSDLYGFNEFERAMLDIIKRDHENEIRKFLMLIGEKFIAKVKLMTPVSTGHLRRSMTRGNPTKSGSTYKIQCGTNVEYAKHVEYGHRTRNGGFVRGRHMIELAYRQINNQLPQEMRTWFERMLRELRL